MSVTLRAVPIGDIRPGVNVRRDLGDLDELAASIRAKGLLQPLVVADHGHYVTVIDGHRRYHAARKAGARGLPCLVTETGGRARDVTTMLAAAMHKQLTPLEQADAFAELLDQGMTRADIAKATGYSSATIGNRLLLRDLPDEARDMVAEKELTIGQAVYLAKQVRHTGHGSSRAGRHRLSPQPFRHGHPCADAAAAMCDHHDTRRALGGIACGQCWEAAIRADERESFTIDDQAVQQAVDGLHSTLNPREREEAIRRLAARGWSDGKIAAHLRVTVRTVLRCRQRAGIPSPARLAKFRKVNEAAS